MAREMKDSGIEWIGEIPEEWDILRLKSLFSFGKGLPITKDSLVEIGVPVISYGQIHGKYNSGVHLHNELIRYVPETYLTTNPESLVHEGDLILADTSEDIDGCGNCAYIDSNMQVFAGYHTIILKASKQTNNKYIAYLMKTDPWRSQLRSKVSGVKVFSISRKIISNAVIILPPVPTQHRIAAFLDRKCAEIDSVIADTQKTIEEYKVLKQSIITEAVTKGVRGERKMKDSGVEWIGDVPEKWKVIKCSRIISGTQNGLTRRDTEKSEGDIVLKLKNIDSNGYIDYSEVNRISLTAKEIETYELQEGDFLFVRVNGSKSLVGKCAIYHDIGSIVAYNDHIIRVQLNESCNHEYFKLYLQSNLGKCEIDLHTSTSAGQFTISGEGLRDMVFVLPPMKEQVEIVTHVSYSLSQTDAIIAAKQQLLAELDAYKKSVIYEYVTGKKEVQ